MDKRSSSSFTYCDSLSIIDLKKNIEIKSLHQFCTILQFIQEFFNFLQQLQYWNKKDLWYEMTQHHRFSIENDH